MSIETATFRSPAAWARFALVAVLGLTIDLYTKWLAFDRLLLGWRDEHRPESLVYQFIPGWLHFELTANPGALFGMGAGKRYVFIAVSIIALLFLLNLFLRSKPTQWVYQIILGMLLAGVMGNMYDRIFHGYVRDMIHALPAHGLWPWIFNVADILLCTGVGLVLIHGFLPEKRQ